MRTLLRSLAAMAILATLVLGAGASAALAAPADSQSAQTLRDEFDDAWCFDDGALTYCSTIEVSLFVVALADGREIATIHVREDVVITDDAGAYVASYATSSFDRTVFADGGQDSTFTVAHTNADGPGYRCSSTTIFKVVNYEIQLDKLVGPLCR